MEYRIHLFWFGVLIAVVGMGILGGCSDEGPTEPERSRTPDFLLDDLEGESFQLSEQQGDVVLLQFFGVNCPVCQDQAATLNELHRELADQGLVVVAIPVQPGDKDNVQTFVEEYDVEYRVLYDDGGLVAPAYGVEQTPTTYFIGRDGWIADRTVGGRSEEDYRELLDPLLSADTE
jgi:peroxiredoxin